MKKILGLDLGTTSIGWALITEATQTGEKSSIIKLGVRAVPLSVDERTNFEKGQSITTCADRTLKRSMRRNLQRYKLRRQNLIEILKTNSFISNGSLLSENGDNSTFETYRLRAKAVHEKISLEEFSRVLLMINKKRGYKSSRKTKNSEDGQLIDGMDIAKHLHKNNITPAQYVLTKDCFKNIPEFYQSDLQTEFDKIWEHQKQYYAFLTDDLKNELRGKTEKATYSICASTKAENNKFRWEWVEEKTEWSTELSKNITKETKCHLTGIKRSGNLKEQTRENYKWREQALKEKLDPEKLIIILQKINGQINNSSNYLGEISNRSKELYFNNQTIGEYLLHLIDEQLEIKNSSKDLDTLHTKTVKNKVFYRQDYLDEFERIWETQAKFHTELTSELKKEIRDIIIFYQRTLKSQKGLISFCEFENRTIEIQEKGKKKFKTIGLRVCPKSSPLFQEFKIWQILNNVKINGEELTQDEKELLFYELTLQDKLSKNDVLKLLNKSPKNTELNFKELEGNRTLAALFKAYQTILDIDISKYPAKDAISKIETKFKDLGYNCDILYFNSQLDGFDFEKQPLYILWHLLYSFESDNSKTGTDKLLDKISKLCGFKKEYAEIIAKITFQPDYGSLCTKAIRKILPFMKEGSEYSIACQYAGYKHSSKSLTKEELTQKTYVDHLDLLPRNSLRNPVVEKILNQMINVVNAITSTYGKPDEIRIELARELKKNAKERSELTDHLDKAKKENEKYRTILKKAPFNLENISRNDIIRYKLYLELAPNGFQTLYSNTYIPQEKLFSKEFDIEHIIPQSKLFDDSFSNKTLESRNANIEKGNKTAFDYVCQKYGEDGLQKYKTKIADLLKEGSISKTKHTKLLIQEANIPDGFIERDIRNTQYIAKKAREILEQLVPIVLPTTGSITERLREDWQLINVLKELNWTKYDDLGLTEFYTDKDGRKIGRIKNWTKRDDHRHHAMDALTIAFTRPSIIQYLNNLNARSDKNGTIYAIEKKELFRDENGKLRFYPPIPLDEFRAEAKKQLENTLISIKAKNKVTTNNINKTKKKTGVNTTTQLTPRGQLHNESIYGSSKQVVIKEETINASFTKEKIATVTNPTYREALLHRLAEFNDDAKKAFTGKNSLTKNPIYLNKEHTKNVPGKVKTQIYETIYTIRKDISEKLSLDKVVDGKIKKILENRLAEFNNEAKKAFSNLDENPIWLNKDKGISIRRITIKGVNNAIPLHKKCDHNGKSILINGIEQPVDYVSTSNNHHVAIYQDAEGNLQENVVSFFEATTRANQGLPIIDKEFNHEKGWTFLFSMKQNEYFIFPKYNSNNEKVFDPSKLDETWLKDPQNYALISPNLFRVQSISCVSYGNNIVRDYKFRHHLETKISDEKLLKDVSYKQFKSLAFARHITKVRINHIGQIDTIGEY